MSHLRDKWTLDQFKAALRTLREGPTFKSEHYPCIAPKCSMRNGRIIPLSTTRCKRCPCRPVGAKTTYTWAWVWDKDSKDWCEYSSLKRRTSNSSQSKSKTKKKKNSDDDDSQDDEGTKEETKKKKKKKKKKRKSKKKKKAPKGGKKKEKSDVTGFVERLKKHDAEAKKIFKKKNLNRYIKELANDPSSSKQERIQKVNDIRGLLQKSSEKKKQDDLYQYFMRKQGHFKVMVDPLESEDDSDSDSDISFSEIIKEDPKDDAVEDEDESLVVEEDTQKESPKRRRYDEGRLGEKKVDDIEEFSPPKKKQKVHHKEATEDFNYYLCIKNFANLRAERRTEMIEADSTVCGCCHIECSNLKMGWICEVCKKVFHFECGSMDKEDRCFKFVASRKKYICHPDKKYDCKKKAKKATKE